MLTQETIDLVMDKIKRSFDRGDTEFMISSFPEQFLH